MLSAHQIVADELEDTIAEDVAWEVLATPTWSSKAMAKTTDKQKLQSLQSQLLAELESRFEAATKALSMQHIQPAEVHSILAAGKFAVQLLRETVDQPAEKPAYTVSGTPNKRI